MSVPSPSCSIFSGHNEYKHPLHSYPRNNHSPTQHSITARVIILDLDVLINEAANHILLVLIQLGAPPVSLHAFVHESINLKTHVKTGLFSVPLLLKNEVLSEFLQEAHLFQMVL